MQQILSTAQRNIMPLMVAIFAFAGCGKVDIATSSSSSSERNINGKKAFSKTFVRTHNGVTRRLETASDIDIQNGQIARFAKGTLIKLQESGGLQERRAELRENAGKLELWINLNGSFRKASAEEEAWLGGFLTEVTTK